MASAPVVEVVAMAATASPSHSQPQQRADDDEQPSQSKDPNPIESQEAVQDSETLEPQNLPNPSQLSLNDQNSQQSDKTEDPLLIVDDEDQPPPPVTSPSNPQRRFNKRKKTAKGNPRKRKCSMIKAKNLIDILNPIPFIPTKKLDLDKHADVLKRLGLYDFSKIEFDRNIRTDLIVQLIVNYDSKKRCSYVNDFRINVNRPEFARALKLPATKQDKGSSSVEEVDLDSEVFSDEAIGFIEDFVVNWMLLHDESWIMPTEIMNWIRCIRDGHPEKMDSASLIWYKVEKELTQGDKLVDCYYASHLQHLIKSQREELFVEMDADDMVADDAEEIVKADEDKEETESKEETELKEEKEETELKQDIKENDEKREEICVVQEHGIELNLGPDVEEIVDEEVKEDDEIMMDTEEFKVENEIDEQENWELNGKNMSGDHYLQRCQSSDLNNFEENKVEEIEDEQVDEEGFDMEANDDSLDRDGLTDDFLQGVEASHNNNNNNFNSHGISSMDLFGSRDGPFMSHGGPSFFNGGKRVMEPEEQEMHHLDQKPNDDITSCMDQMHQLMQKVKMICDSKEQSYENTQYDQQLAMHDLQERNNYMQVIIKSKDDELAKKHAHVFRLEHELFLMVDLLKGYKKSLDDTRLKFSNYRKRYNVKEEPLYKDVGPGGLVLSTREIERLRIQKEQEDKEKFVMAVKDLEDQFSYFSKMHHDKVLMMVDKLDSVQNEVRRVKESFAARKETQKLVDEDELNAELEKNQKLVDEDELNAELEKNQKLVDEDELNVEIEENQKSGDENDNKSRDEVLESVSADAKEKGGGEDLMVEE